MKKLRHAIVPLPPKAMPFSASRNFLTVSRFSQKTIGRFPAIPRFTVQNITSRPALPTSTAHWSAQRRS